MPKHTDRARPGRTMAAAQMPLQIERFGLDGT
jgi:hypothetical protein